MSGNTLSETIASHLRRSILRGELKPGSSIKERDNAAALGASRTPMREAIRILAKEGLVELRKARSPIVIQYDYKEIQDQTDVMLVLEKLAVELACQHATEADIKKIEGIVQHMADIFDHTDPLDMFEIDMNFHIALAEASHNRPLAETHRQYMQRLWRSRYLAASQHRNRERVINEHTQIIDAIKNRDPVAADDAINDHLNHLAEDVREVIESEMKARKTK